MVLTGANSGAVCPESAKAGEPTTIVGKTSYNVFNDGQTDVFFDVVAEVHDDKGNHNEIRRTNISVPVGETVKEDLQPSFTATYASGDVVITCTTTVSGGADKSTTGQSTFVVTDG
jgi:hypothetical protein